MKSKDDVLEQTYMDAKDLKIIIPGLNINKCREFIEEIQQEMEQKKLFIPPGTKPRRALTKLVRKRLGI